MSNVSSIRNEDLERLLDKLRAAAAAHGPEGMRAGEAIAVALVLNRPDWPSASARKTARSSLATS